MRLFTKGSALLALALVSPVDLPGAATSEPVVVVSFVFPGGATKSTELTNSEVRDLLHENFGYMIEWWVRGALAKLDLPHVITVVERKSNARAVTSIAGVANGATGRWVLYVDGVRSRYHINTQIRQHEKRVRLVYEQIRRSAG